MNTNDEIDNLITVIKIAINGDNTEPCYLMIGWLHHSFEMHLYLSDGSVWKGHFSTNRLNGFCKNLHLSRDEYYKRIRQSLSNENSGYRYELKSGFFYWKLKLTDSMLLEGFLPVEKIRCTKPLHTDVLDVLLASNKRLKDKLICMQNKYNSIKTDFARSLKDTEEFLQLKIEMETSLCEKFMNLINMKKVKLDEIESNQDKEKAKLNEEPNIKDTQRTLQSSSTRTPMQRTIKSASIRTPAPMQPTLQSSSTRSPTRPIPTRDSQATTDLRCARTKAASFSSYQTYRIRCSSGTSRRTPLS